MKLENVKQITIDKPRLISNDELHIPLHPKLTVLTTRNAGDIDLYHLLSSAVVYLDKLDSKLSSDTLQSMLIDIPFDMTNLKLPVNDDKNTIERSQAFKKFVHVLNQVLEPTD